MIKCVPTLKVEVEKVATALALSVPVPSVVDPSLNVTVPVGVPELVEVTVAVNVTDCPNVDGLGDEVSEVVLGFAMTSVNDPLLVLKLPSPP